MESSPALFRKIAALTVVLASLTLLSGCGATKSLLGKRKNVGTAKEITELASETVEKPASRDSNELIQTGYQQDDSLPEVKLASAQQYDRPLVNRADAQLQIAPADPISFRQSPGTVLHVGTKDFDQQVLNSDLPVLVDFYGDGCPPCKALSPTLDRIASETPNAKVVKVNVGDSPKIAKQYGVSRVPTVIVFKNGSPVARNTGLAKQDELLEMLAQ